MRLQNVVVCEICILKYGEWSGPLFLSEILSNISASTSSNGRPRQTVVKFSDARTCICLREMSTLWACTRSSCLRRSALGVEPGHDVPVPVRRNLRQCSGSPDRIRRVRLSFRIVGHVAAPTERASSAVLNAGARSSFSTSASLPRFTSASPGTATRSCCHSARLIEQPAFPAARGNVSQSDKRADTAACMRSGLLP